MNPTRLIDSFFEMARIASPSWHEAPMAAYCVRELESMGFDVHVDDSAAQTGSDTGNVVAFLPGTVPGHIAFSSHMDTVNPCQGIEPAFATYVIDGEEVEVVESAGDTILSADDKSGVAAILEGVRSTLEAGTDRPDITVLFTTCEEVNLLGASALDPAVLPKGTPCFVLDADGHPGSVIVGAPFHLTMRAEFTGRAAHAGVEPEAGISAVQMAARAISNMPLGRLDERTTANIGHIEGGTVVNVVAERCFFEAECRSLFEDRLMVQRDAMTEAVEEAARYFGGTVDITWREDYPAILVEDDSPMLKKLVAAAENAGLEPQRKFSGGGADANVLAAHGADAVTLSTGMANFHSTSEYIIVEDLKGIARYVEAIIAEYAR